MQSNQNQHNNNSRKPQQGFNNHTNFIEALKSAGGSIASDTARGISQDLIGGTARQMVDSIFNAGPTNSTNQDQSLEQTNQPFNFNEFMKSSEAQRRGHNQVQQEYEQQENIIFNRRQQEVDQKIKQIQDELKKLAKEIVNLDQAAQSAITQEVVNPGQYHVNYFEKLLSFLRQMRKRVVESRNWAAMQSQRGQAKSYFWKQASQKVSGTKFSLSHERTVATQTG